MPKVPDLKGLEATQQQIRETLLSSRHRPPQSHPRHHRGKSQSELFGFVSNRSRSAYFPRWGFPYSLAVHGIILTVLFYPVVQSPTEPLNALEQMAMDDYTEEFVMYLPTDKEGLEGRLLEAFLEPSAAKSSVDDSLTHPGPQEIRSDSPLPTNRVQTLIQPELEDLPILRPILDLPNLVSMPNVTLAPQAEPPGQPDTVKPEKQPIVEPVQRPEPLPVQTEVTDLPIFKPSLEAPDLLPQVDTGLVFQSAPPELAVQLPDAVKPEEERPLTPSDGETALLAEPEILDLPVFGQSLELPDLAPLTDLGLVAQPAPPDPQVEPSETEEQQPLNPADDAVAASGEPAVGFEAETPMNISEQLEAAPVPIRGVELRNFVVLTPLPNWGTQVEIPLGNSRGRFNISPEPNPDGSGNDPGAPAETGKPPSMVTITFGPTGGSGTATSSDTGSDPDSDAFAGITTIGGFGNSAVVANSGWETRPSLETEYNLFVVSRENSGGGLPSLGVFSNQQIHTVYLDMRESESEWAPRWTLEFAAIQETNTPEDAGELDDTDSGLVLPFPVVKERPKLAPELVRRHIGEMVIVSGVINVQGKMEETLVRQTPNPLLNRPMLETLRKWVFRPALQNGEPVRLKALVGIPLWLPVPLASPDFQMDGEASSEKVSQLSDAID